LAASYREQCVQYKGSESNSHRAHTLPLTPNIPFS